MPRYFLDLHNRIGLTRDEEGQEFGDTEEAMVYAVTSIRSILAEEVKSGLIDIRGRVEVFDSARRLLKTVPFSSAVELRLPSVSSQTEDAT